MRKLFAGLALVGALALTATNANAWCDNWLGRGCDGWGWNGGWNNWAVAAPYGAPGYVGGGGFSGQTVIIIIPGGGGRYYGGGGPYNGGDYNVGPYYGGAVQYYQPGYRW